MAALSRFFIDSTKLKAGGVNFDGSEFHHMVRVTRHKVGDHIRFFDGNGREADAEILTISRQHATLKVGKVETIARPDLPELILAVPIPKFSRADWLIEKAVELGVTQLIPLTTTRSVVDPRDSKIESFRNSIISSCKQCGRSHLMHIEQPMKLSDLVKNRFRNHLAVMGHPGGVPLKEAFAKSLFADATAAATPKVKPGILAIIGPEGGFTVEEVTQCVSSGARLVSLGHNILRVETAALTAVVLLQSAR